VYWPGEVPGPADLATKKQTVIANLDKLLGLDNVLVQILIQTVIHAGFIGVWAAAGLLPDRSRAPGAAWGGGASRQGSNQKTATKASTKHLVLFC
jgi:hypothetical protein